MEIEAGDIIALGALAFSAFTFWRQRKSDAKVQWLNSLLIEKEEGEAISAKRADISASIVQPTKHNYQLRVFNRGKGTARNVRVEPLEGVELFDSGDMRQMLPYPALDTHQNFNLHLRVYMQSPRRTKVRIEWDDDVSGGSKELTLDVF